MPMYEYRCEACGAKFERLSWKTETAGDTARCGCGSTNVERIWFSRVAIAGRSDADFGGDFGEGGSDGDAGEDCGAEGGCCGGGCQVN